MELWQRSSIRTWTPPPWTRAVWLFIGFYCSLSLQELQQMIQAEIWIKAGLNGTFWGGGKAHVQRSSGGSNQKQPKLWTVWCLKGRLSLFSPPSSSTLFKIPGLSPDPRPQPGQLGEGGGGRWGLKCNPGPVTTKAVAPEGQWQTTYSELQCYPSANPSEWLHFTGLHGRTPLCTSNAPPLASLWVFIVRNRKILTFPHSPISLTGFTSVY